MPELPEVEYTARQLRAHIVGATIRAADVFWARTIGYPSPQDFRAGIAGRHIERVRRRGKFLLLDLSGDVFLTIHRRMTGNFLLLGPGWKVDCGLRESDAVAWDTRGPSFIPPDDVRFSYSRELHYCRVCFNFADGRRLLYTDPRKFGRMELWATAREEEVFADLGPEPLDQSFTTERLAGGLARHHTSIKAALLDQRVVAGLGNIYADEALFFAGIHPLRRSD